MKRASLMILTILVTTFAYAEEAAQEFRHEKSCAVVSSGAAENFQTLQIHRALNAPLIKLRLVVGNTRPDLGEANTDAVPASDSILFKDLEDGNTLIEQATTGSIENPNLVIEINSVTNNGKIRYSSDEQPVDLICHDIL